MKKIAFPVFVQRLHHPFFLAFLICLLCGATGICTGQAQVQKKVASATTSQKAMPVFTYKIIPAANGTYGYDIYADGKLHIHQAAIPAMPGNDGFKTKEAAEKVAALAISKMKKGESLPTISPGELKRLGVL